MASPSAAIPLTAELRYVPSLTLLWLTVGTAALTALFCAIDAVAKPRARLLLHGDAMRPSPQQPPSPQRARTSRRTLFWTLLSRVLLCALLGASLFPALSVALRLYSEPPLSQLAPHASNVWVARLLRRTLAAYAATQPSRAPLARAPLGLSTRLLSPQRRDPNHAWTWRFVLAVLLLLSLLGVLLRLVPSYLPTRKLVAPIILLQPLLWLLIAVPAAFVRPSSLPLDSSPLLRKWLDFEYSTRPTRIDEHRFLDNWFVRTEPEPAPPQHLPQLANISLTFCDQFNALLPPSSDSALQPQQQQLQLPPLSPLTPRLAADVLVVYTVGKPSGPDHYRAIAYTCLPVMVAAPILVAQTLRSYILYPLFAIWIFIFVLFALLATPSVLRPIAAPFRPAQQISFCARSYTIQVVDASTKLVIRADIAIFALTVLAAMLQGYRWVKLVEDHASMPIQPPAPLPQPKQPDPPDEQNSRQPVKAIV